MMFYLNTDYYVMLVDEFGSVLINRVFNDVVKAKIFFDKVIKDYEFGGYKSRELSDNVTEIYDNNSFYHLSLNESKE